MFGRPGNVESDMLDLAPAGAFYDRSGVDLLLLLFGNLCRRQMREYVRVCGWNRHNIVVTEQC